MELVEYCKLRSIKKIIKERANDNIMSILMGALKRSGSPVSSQKSKCENKDHIHKSEQSGSDEEAFDQSNHGLNQKQKNEHFGDKALRSFFSCFKKTKKSPKNN